MVDGSDDGGDGEWRCLQNLLIHLHQNMMTTYDDDQSTCWKVMSLFTPRMVVNCPRWTQAGVAEETIKTGVGTNNCHRTI